MREPIDDVAAARASRAGARRVLGLLAGLACLGFAFVRSGATQEVAPPKLEEPEVASPEHPPPLETVSADDSAPARSFPDAAPLAIDDELARFLDDVDEQLAGGRGVVAIRAWQRVLDGLAGSGDLAGSSRLRSFCGRPLEILVLEGRAYARYVSTRAEIERRQRGLDAELERQHSVESTGEVERLWQEYETTRGRQPLEALATRFFNGPRGGEATLRLAALELDRGHAAEASRLLTRLIDEHPRGAEFAPRAVPRLVIAQAWLGEVEEAQRTWEAARAERRVSPRTVRRVERELQRGALRSRTAPNDWTSGAGSSGVRLAPAVPSMALSARVTEAWSLAFDLQPADVAPSGLRIGLPQERVGDRLPKSPGLAEGWRSLERTPVGHAVAVGGRLYVRGRERMVCCDAATGRVLWMGRRNEPVADALGRSFGANREQFGELPRTPEHEETAMFCDAVPAEFAVHEGRVYALEGRVLEIGSAVTEEGFGDSDHRRVRDDELVAYDAVTGRLLWRRRADEPGAPAVDAGFLAAPAAHGDTLLVPTSLGGEIWLHALDRGNGRTLWRTFLCDEPYGGCSPWSPVRVVVNEGRAYVLPGTGLVFALDATSGDVGWAVRYSRTTALDLSREDRSRARGSALDFLGWDRDELFVDGPRLIVCPSDSTRLFAVDRRDGRLLWDAESAPLGEPRVTRIAGQVGDALIAEGHGLVRRYELSTGRMTWQTAIPGATGRGIVTPNAVLVAADERLLVLDPANGTVVRQIEFVTPTGEPLGNLACDGERLYAAGAMRVAALVPLDDRLEQLVRRVEAGDALARLERARLFARLGRRAEALADVLSAAGAGGPSDEGDAIARQVLETIAELEFARLHPRAVLGAAVDGRLARAARLPTTEAARSAWTAVVHEALVAIAREEIAGAAEEVLRVADLAEDHFVRLAVRGALTATVRAQDLERLARSIASDSTADRFDPSTRRTAAIHALESERFEDVDDVLREAWERGTPRDRLAVAETRLNRADRSALGYLVELLAAEDVAVRSRADLLLRLATGEEFGFDPHAAVAKRERAIGAWRTWIAEHGDVAALVLPVGRPGLPRGRTLVTNYSRHTVTEYDGRGRVVWEASLPAAHGCFGSADGSRLVSVYNSRTLVEFAPGDDDPRVQWQKGELAGRPYNVERLPNGHLLVPYYDTGQIVEFDAGGNVVWSATLQGAVADATRLEDGRTLVAWYSQNAIVELDREGNVVPDSQMDDMPGVRSVQRLPNGNTLAALYRGQRVVELDPAGEVVWSREELTGAVHAQRVPGGNTLVVHRSGVIEIRPDGTIAWELTGPGHGRVHRY